MTPGIGLDALDLCEQNIWNALLRNDYPVSL
jgi:hypothetical protein